MADIAREEVFARRQDSHSQSSNELVLGEEGVSKLPISKQVTLLGVFRDKTCPIWILQSACEDKVALGIHSYFWIPSVYALPRLHQL